MSEVTSVFVITPHPDDAEGGAGGAMVRWVKQGCKVVLVVCTNGNKGTNDVNMPSARLAEIREKEQRNAAQVLGIAEVVFLGFDDQGLEDGDDFREKLVRQIRIHRPELVVTVDPNRRYIRHRDHYMTGRVTLDAVFPYARDYLAYPHHLEEGLKPHKVQRVYLWGSDESDAYLDITDTFQIKRDALYCHVSQVGLPTDESEKRARERYATIGKKAGVSLAEQFKLLEIG